MVMSGDFGNLSISYLEVFYAEIATRHMKSLGLAFTRAFSRVFLPVILREAH